MFPSRFRYEAPQSLDEAISLLRDGGDYVKVLAGGQSLVPMMKLRFASPEMLVDINNVPGLDYHRTDADGSLHVGARSRRWPRRRRWLPTHSCGTGARSSGRYATPTRRATGPR